MAIALEAVSIYFGNSTLFWIIFCIIYIFGIVGIVANIYKLDSKDRIEKGEKHWLDSILFFRVYRILFQETRRVLCCSSDKDKTEDKDKDPEQNRQETQGSRRGPLLVFITLLCVVNIGLCAYFAYEASTGYVTASNYILILFIINMGIYFFYYLFMKYRSGEWIQWRPKIYLGMITILLQRILYNFLCSDRPCLLWSCHVLLPLKRERLESLPSRVKGTESAMPAFQLL